MGAHDQIAHVFGPDSFEEWDELLRLDGELARFFADLDARFGPGGWMTWAMLPTWLSTWVTMVSKTRSV